MPKIKIGRRTVTAIEPVQKPTIFYDTDLKGFGLKVHPSGVSSWIIEYRPGSGGRGVSARRIVLGRLNSLTPEAARKEAGALLAKVRLGSDPAAERSQARKAESVGDLLDLFMANHIRPKRKRRTVILFDGYIKNHVRPSLGRVAAPALTQAELERLHRTIGKTTP